MEKPGVLIDVVTDHYSRYCSWPPRVHSDTVCSCIQLYSHGTSPPLERTGNRHTSNPAFPAFPPGGCGWEVSFLAVAVLDRVRRRVVTANSRLWGARAGGGETSPLRRCEPTHHVFMSFVCCAEIVVSRLGIAASAGPTPNRHAQWRYDEPICSRPAQRPPLHGRLNIPHAGGCG